MNLLARRLYELRTQRNLKQEELAEALGVSRQAVSKWEMGTGVPSLENLKAISDFFGVTIDSLVKDSPAPPESEQPSVKEESEAAPNKHISPVEKDPFLKRVANAATVALGFIAVIVLRSVTAVLVTTIMNMIITTDAAMYRAMPAATVIHYVISSLYALPFLYLAAVMIDKNMTVFSKELYSRQSPEKRRIIIKKVAAAFAVYLVMPAATNVLEIALWQAGFRAMWSSSSALGVVSVTLETFIIYAILALDRPSMFKSKFNLLAAIVLSGLLITLEILGSYNRMRVQPANYTAVDITYPRINDIFGIMYAAFILMTVSICHTRSAFVKEENENEQSAEAAL